MEEAEQTIGINECIYLYIGVNECIYIYIYILSCMEHAEVGSKDIYAIMRSLSFKGCDSYPRKAATTSSGTGAIMFAGLDVSRFYSIIGIMFSFSY